MGYGRELTDAEVQEGIDLCLANALRLRARALDMERLGDSGLAVYLAGMRVEEIGKALLLHEVLGGGPPEGAWSVFWRRFRSHPQKWAEVKLAFMNWSAVYSRVEAEALFRTGSRSEANLKNLGVYVDYRDDRGWLNPTTLPLDNQVGYVLELGDRALPRVEHGVRLAGRGARSRKASDDAS